MSSTAIATVIKMMESLPEAAQNQIAEHLREYIEDLRDEMQWDMAFQKTQHQLVAAARKAKQEIAEGKAKPLDYNQL
ncbi:hypothetical protein NUACC21_07220 [Scytonema sp. NUACC21]